MKQPVTQIGKGGIGTISHFSDDQVASKLLSMGILPGSTVSVMRVAPFNGGFYLKIGAANLVLRTEEAACIIINSAAAQAR